MKLLTTALRAAGGSSRAMSKMMTKTMNRNQGNPIRWGILSAGKIASDYAKAISVTDGATTHAVAARSLERAQTFARDHGISTSYGTYEDLLADPDVDVVYIGSVADQHYDLATQSLLAGKPTVVEKPFTLNYQDTSDIINLAKTQNVFLMEGMWTRCFPAMRYVRTLIESGEIGKLVTVQGDFGWSTEDCSPQDRIWCPDAGGMILDIGMYMAQLGQVAFPNSTVEKIQAVGLQKNGVDHTVAATLLYKYRNKVTSSNNNDNGILQFYVTGEANTEERVVFQGTNGRIVMDSPAHVPTRVRLVLDEGRGSTEEQIYDFPLPNDTWTTWNYPGSIGFTHQIQAVNEALRAEEKQCIHFTHEDSLQMAYILDEILAQVLDTKKQEPSSSSSSNVIVSEEEISA
mmetsp:Transcript_22299/g.31313  ORF Transcript_22299/g.31313 Transcript_22299/m.31313 type:complete len:402 (+) Transcript_22299:224-1429(+)